ncbi:hypothetical protein [Psychrobacter sp.]|uniref:hypothetical protein n=1 Tax=Psychrobacter sp. TaxID=56811 RepID=UPI003C728079
MDIYSMEVKTSSGMFNVEVSRSDNALQSIIKDLLLKKLLSEKDVVTNKPVPVPVPVAQVEQPLLTKCVYTKGALKQNSRQMQIRRLVIADLMKIGNAWRCKEMLTNEIVDKVELSRASIDTYVNGMAAAGIIKKNSEDKKLIKLTEEFINQSKEGETV